MTTVLGCLGGAWGIHDVDIAQWVTGNDHTTPVETEGEGLFFDDIRDVPYTWTVEHKYANGVRVIHMDSVTAKKRAEQFNFGGMASVMFGTEGWIYISRQGMRTQARVADARSDRAQREEGHPQQRPPPQFPERDQDEGNRPSRTSIPRRTER